MKRLVLMFFFTLMIATAPAHSDDSHNDSENETVAPDQKQGSEDGFQSLYSSYSSGAVYVLAEVVLVLIASLFAVRHYLRKSESDSIKELVSDKLT